MSRLSKLYRTAFVTGASAGLGCAFAEMLLNEGVEVWGTARRLDRLDQYSGRLGFSAVALDLEHPDEAVAAYETAAKNAGGFDLLVNNAGYGIFAPFHRLDFSIWQKQVDAMLGTTARLNHLALGGMLTVRNGCIVNVASVATDFPLPYMAGYNVAKAGLSALSESLMFETKGTGVAVIDFRPGDFCTDFNRSVRAADIKNNDTRLEMVWQILEKNLNHAPKPEVAAFALHKALLRRRSGTVRCGSFFQAYLAPFLVRFVSSGLRRRALARYFGDS